MASLAPQKAIIGQWAVELLCRDTEREDSGFTDRMPGCQGGIVGMPGVAGGIGHPADTLTAAAASAHLQSILPHRNLRN